MNNRIVLLLCVSLAFARATFGSCSPLVVGWGYDVVGEATPPAGLTGVVAVAGGAYHSLALKSDGTVVGWGDNGVGEVTTPVGLSNVTAIAAGAYHSLALKSDGTVVGWGNDGDGEATPPLGLTGVVAVAGGWYHSLALKSDGTVIAWGLNNFGQMTVPAGATGVVAIAAGAYHSLALKSNGSVIAWGYNCCGQTVPPAGATGVVAIAAGGYHNLALKNDGTIVGFGYNGYGQTTAPAGLSGVVGIAGGIFHSLALTSGGAVIGWGYNADGETSVPGGLAGATMIAAGFYHSLAVADRPGPPSALAAVAIDTNQVSLSWVGSSSGVDGFEIDRALDVGGIPGSWTQITNVAVGVTSYTDTAPDTTYWYRVRAFNSCSQSPWSTTRVPVVILDDLCNSGVRTNQNPPTSSAWWASTGDNLTNTAGTMTLTVGGSSIMAITYFTPDTNSSPVELNVGDTLTVGFNFTFNGVPPVGSSSQGFRVGLFNFADSTLNPKRVTADGFNNNTQGNGVQGYALFGKMYGAFSDNTPIDIRKRTNLSSGALLGTSGDWTSIAKDSLSTGAFPGFANLTPYSLQFILRRSGLSSLFVSIMWSNLTSGAVLSDSFTDNSASNFRFDGISFRPQNNSQAPATNQFTEVKIELKSAPLPPAILTQPQNQPVSSGQSATFSVAATGGLPLRYQWFFNTTTLLADRTNSTLTITNVQLADAGAYSVLVSNSFDSVTSVAATLFVTNAAPIILAQPQSLTVNPGQDASFSVAANGSPPLSYQWFYNTNTLLAGATSATLTMTNAQSGDAGTYSVVVSNHNGTVASSNAVLAVSLFPLAPSALTATAVPGTEIDLSWTDNSSIEDGFEIERAPDAGGSPGTWAVLATVATDVTFYVDQTVTTNTAYWYRVRAFNSQGDSPYSNQAAARVSSLQDGFHTVNFDTIGGEGGTTVTATTAAQFNSFVNLSGKYIVQVQGTLVVSNRTVSSNKTILGLGTNATLVGNLELSGVSNIVVRNLFITNPTIPGDGDGITIKNSSHHIWVDHCTFTDCQDGELDITLASDFVTVSWCKFHYTFDSGHNFVNLIGADDSNTGDAGKLHVTFHHNWWSTLTHERMPRVRYGRVHSYNNYFNAPGNNYCVRAALESEVLIEGDYFENVSTPWEVFFSTGTPGKISAAGNMFVNVSGTSEVGTNTVFTPPYVYTLDDVADVPNIVTNNAGAGKLAGALFNGWQLQYFGCIACAQAAASADPDGDGLNNQAEFLAGTNPTDSLSSLRIIAVLQQGDDVAITWATAGGRTNAVQASAGMDTNFADITGPLAIAGSGDMMTNYVDTGGATNNPARYYRVRLVP